MKHGLFSFNNQLIILLKAILNENKITNFKILIIFILMLF